MSRRERNSDVRYRLIPSIIEVICYLTMFVAESRPILNNKNYYFIPRDVQRIPKQEKRTQPRLLMYNFYPFTAHSKPIRRSELRVSISSVDENHDQSLLMDIKHEGRKIHTRRVSTQTLLETSIYMYRPALNTDVLENCLQEKASRCT